jgi:hypothetical protein
VVQVEQGGEQSSFCPPSQRAESTVIQTSDGLISLRCMSVRSKHQVYAVLGSLLFGWIDPGRDGQFGWSRCDVPEPLRVGQEGGVKGGGARPGEIWSAAVMNGV